MTDGGRKDLDALLRRLRADGWTVTRRKGTGHFKLCDPAGRLVTFTGSTPSDWRALRNLRGRLRRAEAGR